MKKNKNTKEEKFSKAKKSLTAQYRQVIKEVIGEIVKSLEQGDYSLLEQYFEFTAKFKCVNYSAQNKLLILSQAPGATFTAGIESWKAKGFSVKRDAKPITIIMPDGFIKVDNLDNRDGALWVAKNPLLRFRLANNLTLKELSDLLSIDDQLIENIEKGKVSSLNDDLIRFIGEKLPSFPSFAEEMMLWIQEKPQERRIPKFKLGTVYDISDCEWKGDPEKRPDMKIIYENTLQGKQILSGLIKILASQGYTVEFRKNIKSLLHNETDKQIFIPENLDVINASLELLDILAKKIVKEKLPQAPLSILEAFSVTMRYVSAKFLSLPDVFAPEIVKSWGVDTVEITSNLKLIMNMAKTLMMELEKEFFQNRLSLLREEKEEKKTVEKNLRDESKEYPDDFYR